MQRHIHIIVLVFILAVAVLIGFVDDGAQKLAKENGALKAELNAAYEQLEQKSGEISPLFTVKTPAACGRHPLFQRG